MTMPRTVMISAIVLTMLCLCSHVHADRAFTCGFEENDIAAGSTMWTTLSGSPTVSTTQKHSGTYALNVATAGATGYVQRNHAANVTSGTLFVRLYLYITSLPTGTNTAIWRVLNSGAAVSTSLHLNMAGTLAIRNDITTTVDTTSTTLSTGTWYRIELRLLLSDTVGQIEGRLYLGDSASVTETWGIGNFTDGNGTNEDTLSTNVLQHRFGLLVSTTANIYIDDIAINTDGGSLQTTWPGPGSIMLLTPDSDVAAAWEDETSGASTYANVNDVPGTPDDVNYNFEDDTLDQVDRFGLTNPGAEMFANSTITLVDLYGRVGSTQTSATSLQLRLYDEAATPTTGPVVSAAVNGWKMVTTAEHLVYDATGKTKANLESFSAGYLNVTDTVTRARRVSALWANVEWTGGSAPPATVRRRVLIQ
jgi:hypothetical protein